MLRVCWGAICRAGLLGAIKKVGHRQRDLRWTSRSPRKARLLELKCSPHGSTRTLHAPAVGLAVPLGGRPPSTLGPLRAPQVSCPRASAGPCSHAAVSPPSGKEGTRAARLSGKAVGRSETAGKPATQAGPTVRALLLPRPRPRGLPTRGLPARDPALCSALRSPRGRERRAAGRQGVRVCPAGMPPRGHRPLDASVCQQHSGAL